MGTNNQRKIRETAHAGLWKISGYDEYKVAYKALNAARTEATAYYTDDLEDAEGTMRIMERDAILNVVPADLEWGHDGFGRYAKRLWADILGDVALEAYRDARNARDARDAS